MQDGNVDQDVAPAEGIEGFFKRYNFAPAHYEG
jgi:hypothetical protein